MTATVALHKGHDLAYFTRGQGSGGCTGAMSNYAAAGEPSGRWAGKAAARLGLTGQVNPAWSNAPQLPAGLVHLITTSG